ncbi:MAG: uncharacterized protein A8A55_3566, partial [Amphiamblys sp. WSBS2006]
FFLRRIGEDEKPLVSFLEKIPPNSINCTLKKITLKKTVLINILPKLRIRKDCEVELVLLDADKREQVAAILDTKEMFCLGRVKEMQFKDYAVGVFPRVGICGDCEVDVLVFSADKREHVAAILDAGEMFCVGRVERICFGDYAVSIFSRMSIRGDCE